MEESYSIWYDDAEGFVRMLWKGYQNSHQFREGTVRMLSVLQETGAREVLGDIRDMVLISQEDQQWVVGQFIPLAIGSGFRALALLQPRHYFNKVAVQTIAYQVKSEQLQIRFFEREEEAVRWLREIKAVPA